MIPFRVKKTIKQGMLSGVVVLWLTGRNRGRSSGSPSDPENKMVPNSRLQTRSPRMFRSLCLVFQHHTALPLCFDIEQDYVFLFLCPGEKHECLLQCMLVVQQAEEFQLGSKLLLCVILWLFSHFSTCSTETKSCSRRGFELFWALYSSDYFSFFLCFHPWTSWRAPVLPICYTCSAPCSHPTLFSAFSSAQGQQTAMLWVFCTFRERGLWH